MEGPQQSLLMHRIMSLLQLAIGRECVACSRLSVCVSSNRMICVSTVNVPTATQALPCGFLVASSHPSVRVFWSQGCGSSTLDWTNSAHVAWSKPKQRHEEPSVYCPEVKKSCYATRITVHPPSCIFGRTASCLSGLAQKSRVTVHTVTNP